MPPALMETARVSVEFANRPDELTPMTVFGRALGRFRISPLKPRPHALVVSMSETLGEIVGFFVESGKKRADRRLVSVGHDLNDGPQEVYKASVAVPVTLEARGYSSRLVLTVCGTAL
jgi:hypothetical protein